MATNTWTGSAGDDNWTTAGNWSLDHIPLSSEDVVVGNVTVAITGSSVVGATLTNAGQIEMDILGGQGGSNMTITGALTNSNYFEVGSSNDTLSANDTVKAASINNTGGTFDLYGSSTATATLNIGSAASFNGTAGVLAGDVNVSSDGLVEFTGTSQITTIAANSELSLTGTSAFIADAGINLTSNSALTGLSTVTGDLYLYNGAKVNPGGALTNNGQIFFDLYGGQGGAGMTISGALTNTNLIQVGSSNDTLSANDTLQAASVNNTGGTIDLYGSESATAKLNVLSAASLSATAGVLAGSVNVNSDALVEFTGTSQITTIAANSELSLTGTSAFIADAGINLTSNSALTGLSTITGDLYLYNGAKVNPGGALTNNGQIFFDLYGGQGGAGMTISGALTNTNLIQVGSSNDTLSANDTLQAASVNNTGGTIDLYGSGSATAELNVLSAASLSATAGVLAGSVNVNSDGLVEFTGTSQITTIAANSELSLTGTSAFIADAGINLTSNSALTGLSTITGDLYLYNGAKVNPGGALTNNGQIFFDLYGGQGGAGMTISGALTNTNLIQVGSSNDTLSANDTLQAASVNNTGGTIDLYGSGSATAELNVLSAASLSATAGVLAGSVNVNSDALVEFTGTSQITTIAANSELSLTGTSAFIADAGINLTSNSALTGLSTITGDLYLYNGAKVNPGGALTNNGQIFFDLYGGQGGAGMTISGALTNTNLIQVGSSNDTLSANDTLQAASVNNTGGTIDLYGSGSATAELNVLSAASLSATAGVLAGSVNVNSDGLVEFTGTSQITTIAANSELSLTGTSAFIADAGINLTSNSALTGLSTITGDLYLYNGAKVNPGGALTNNGQIFFDLYGGQGGAGMTISGALTNTNLIQVGSSNDTLSANDTLQASGLTNSGTIDLYSSATEAATLSVTGAATNFGSIFANAYSHFTVTGLYSQTSIGSLTLGLAGTAAGQFATLSATGGLSLMGGVLKADLEGVTLSAGETFNLATFTAGKLTGLFGTLEVGNVSGNGVYAAAITGTLSAGLVYNYSAGNIELEIIATPTTQAETWTTGSGNWSTTASWSNGAPSFYSNVTIGSVASANVTLSTDATIDGLTINASDTLTTASGTGLTVGGALSLVSGASIVAGGEVAIGGGGTIAGSVSGGGTLVLDGGAYTIASPASISTGAWIIGGGVVTIDENVTYSGNFTLSTGATVTVNGFYLNLQGNAVLANATVNGNNRLITHAATAVSALTIGGTAEWENAGTATESAGGVIVGDGSSNVATLLNTSTGVYDIIDNSGIGHGGSTASSINNQGTFEKTGGTGTSTISATFVDTGTVTATSGTLAFTGPSASFAGAITGTGGTVQLSTATTLKSGTTATVSNLTESGAGTIVTLIENLGYGGTFTDGASTNFNIASGDALTLSGTTSIAGTIGSAGTLDLTGGTTTLASGGGVFTSAWNVSGASTDLVVDENFTYTQTFSLTGGATVTDQSTVAGYFYITGAATISNATVNGFSRFITGAGGATIANFTVGGTVSFQNKGADTQSGGNVTVGDSAGDVATMLNTSTGTYDITDDSGIGRGGSTASLFTNQGLFEKTGGTGTSTVSVSFTNSATVTVTSGTLAFSGPGNSFNGALAGVGGTVAFTGGAASLKSGTTASVSNLSETGSGTLVTLLENLTYAGAFSEGAGSTFAIASGDTLTLDGSNTIAGTINNSGALDLSGGATAIDAGANLYVSTWALLGSGTTVTANAGVNYAGAFSEAAGDTFTLSGGYLLLNGTDTFSGGTVNGSRFLYTEGTTSVSGLTIGGTAEWENTKTVTENGGSVTIGDATSSAATLFNTSTGTYDITDNSGIGIGTSASSSITNQGLMEKTGGTTTSTISPAIANGGTLEVTSGTLDLRGAVTGTGTDTISGASTLEFDSQAALTQTIGFTGAGGTLYIESPATFSSSTTSSASISGFDTGGAGGDTIELKGSWSLVGYVENGGGTAGTLTLASGGGDIGLTLLGDYTGVFHPTVSGANTLVTYTA